MDLEELFAGRRACTEAQWIAVLLRSTGLEPTHFDDRVKWHLQRSGLSVCPHRVVVR